MPRRRLVVFAKPPAAGRVKTRMQPDLSAAQAADLARAFLDDLLARLPRELAPAGVDVSLAWGLGPGDVELPAPVPTFRQMGRDLGERMLAAAEQFAARDERTVIVGADLPDLPAPLVEEAFDALEKGADLVLGPALDGGFYLIGFGAAALRPELFAGVSWGSESVLAATVANASTLGLRLHRLATLADVDRPSDLVSLAERLGRPAAVACPRTQQWLAQAGCELAGWEGGSR